LSESSEFYDEFSTPFCYYVVIRVDDTKSILDVVAAQKSSLAYFIEPDFELPEHLLKLDVLDLRQLTDIRSERTVFRRNDALLDLLTTEDQCVRFLIALQRAGQEHVVNFIKENGGQRQSDDITYLSNVAHVQRDKQSNYVTSCLSMSLFSIV